MRNVRGLRAAVVVGFCLSLASAGFGCGSESSDPKPEDGSGGDGSPGDGSQGDGESGDGTADGASGDGESDGNDGLDAGTDAGESTEGDAGGDPNGGVIEGDALLHAVFSNAVESNVKTDELNYDMPTGTTSETESGPFTLLSGTITSNGGLDSTSVTIAIAGELRAGASFELVPDAYSASPGYGYVNVTQSSYSSGETNFFMPASGTVTIEALQGTAIKVSGSGIAMQVATSNAPGNDATGTFDLDVEIQVLTVSGL